MFVIYQVRDILKPRKQNSLPRAIGPFFIVSSLCNGMWTFAFVHGAIGLSVVFILLLAASLYTLLAATHSFRNAPVAAIASVWWPLLIYTGWVTVASVTNVASWLQSNGIAITVWMSCTALVALLIGLVTLLVVRNMRELLLASTWGIIAIGVQQVHHERAVALTAFAVGGLLLVAVAVHGYKNRQTNPFRRLLS